MYDNEGTDIDTANIHRSRPGVTYIHVANQAHAGGLTYTWNDGVRRCLALGADVVLVLNHDIAAGPTLRHLLDAASNSSRLGAYGPVSDYPMFYPQVAHHPQAGAWRTAHATSQPVRACVCRSPMQFAA